jgi:hypothetical protein
MDAQVAASKLPGLTGATADVDDGAQHSSPLDRRAKRLKPDPNAKDEKSPGGASKQSSGSAEKEDSAEGKGGQGRGRGRKGKAVGASGDAAESCDVVAPSRRLNYNDKFPKKPVRKAYVEEFRSYCDGLSETEQRAFVAYLCTYKKSGGPPGIVKHFTGSNADVLAKFADVSAAGSLTFAQMVLDHICQLLLSEECWAIHGLLLQQKFEDFKKRGDVDLEKKYSKDRKLKYDDSSVPKKHVWPEFIQTAVGKVLDRQKKGKLLSNPV